MPRCFHALSSSICLVYHHQGNHVVSRATSLLLAYAYNVSLRSINISLNLKREKFRIVLMSDTSFAAVADKRKLLQIIDDDWIEDSLSDDGMLLDDAHVLN